jgi:hypothetical protein
LAEEGGQTPLIALDENPEGFLVSLKGELDEALVGERRRLFSHGRRSYLDREIRSG